jgi:hypothetical protein
MLHGAAQAAQAEAGGKGEPAVVTAARPCSAPLTSSAPPPGSAPPPAAQFGSALQPDTQPAFAPA